jgi:hypothetical protein
MSPISTAIQIILKTMLTITSIEITAEKSYKCQYELKVTNLKLIIELKNDGNSDPGVIEVNVHLQKHGKK